MIASKQISIRILFIRDQIRILLCNLIHGKIRVIDMRICKSSVCRSAVRLRHQEVVDQEILLMFLHQILPDGCVQIFVQSLYLLLHWIIGIHLRQIFSVDISPVIAPAPITIKGTSF